jgi:hypothetical protein
LSVRSGYDHSEKRLTFGEAQQIIVCVRVDAHNLFFAADKLRKLFLAQNSFISIPLSPAQIPSEHDSAKRRARKSKRRRQ